ncbi:RNA polymerase sigma factor [Spirosoma montaniterrae]|uniref:RNA polymerase subunit sigma-24 n=1 Tax=Spirosoma montaniterrae TaxID=1178516 RepID=A0A1P9X3D6_9BACT|nr:RNA polymerase sigma factor [Spirosoma montaniterrae]AQG82129.1 RNA polymerase subunit sigma-24 [Spirosoma montaniterrae]
MQTTDLQQETLAKAMNGNINAFQELFSAFQSQLKSYLYRLTASRNDADDLTHDAFIKAYDELSTFKGQSSLKTWVFQIATNLAYNQLKRQKRWTPDVMEQAKNLVVNSKEMQALIGKVSETASDARYDMKEHIDTCFTCMAKNLPIENQIALILKDVYDFSVADICLILDKTEGIVKYLLQDGRNTLMDIFDNRCALIHKNGVCNQCSELNGWFNPKENQQQALMKLDLVRGSKKFNREELYVMRSKLVSALDPLRSPGADLQELLVKCNRVAMQELTTLV